MTTTAAELDAMRRAIAVSALGVGSTSPNPPVGCVILDQYGTSVAEGYHRRKGESHAEVNALAAAGPSAAGGTAVVTLEPCNHHGRTPPCHQALIDAGIRRVLIALIDPTSRGDGGAARLRSAGVEVRTAVLADEARIVLGPWLDALHLARPRVTWLYEQSANQPRPSVDVLAQIRARVDAVVEPDGRVEDGIAAVHGRDVVGLPRSPPTTEPARALAELFDGGVRSVLLHGSADLARPYLDQALVDEVVIFLPVSEPSTPAVSTPGGGGFLPPGFTIDTIDRCAAGVLLRARVAGNASLAGRAAR